MDAFLMWARAIAQKGLAKLEGGLEAKGINSSFWRLSGKEGREYCHPYNNIIVCPFVLHYMICLQGVCLRVPYSIHD